MPFLNYTIMIVSTLISVAFYTILERKILSYIQIRKGPNKVGFMGIFQPFSDALKLFNKNLMSMEYMNFMMSMLIPMISLFLSIMMLSIIPVNNFNSFDIKHSMLFLFILSSISVYSTLLIGWTANSKYSQIGAVRSIAQMISYEMSFFMIIFTLVILSHSYSILQISQSQNMLFFLWGNIILWNIWLTSCMAETNRSPFDFAEGESELVSGFNVEYMGGWFALIFLAEYLSMIILSMLSSIMFFKSMNNMFSFLFMIIITILFLWIRGTFPRFRYDMLMKLSWKIFLPILLYFIPLPFMILINYY